MEQIKLGTTNLKVSKIGLGTLTMGGLQRDFNIEEIDKVVARCVERGINFCDTAELYGSYNVVNSFIKRSKDAIVASKSYAYDKTTARNAVEDCLRQIGREYVDIFLLHEQESQYTMKGHMEAVEEYSKMVDEGKIKYLGVSTHKIQCVKDIVKFPFVKVCHPLINHRGFGLFDGTKQDMEQAIERAMDNGIGIYAMKIFGGGHLLSERIKALEYFKMKPYSGVIGMSDTSEVDFNCDIIENGKTIFMPKIEKKKLQIHDWCELCEECVNHCPQKALRMEKGKIRINRKKCVLCGYCGGYCKSLCIKIY